MESMSSLISFWSRRVYSFFESYSLEGVGLPGEAMPVCRGAYAPFLSFLWLDDRSFTLGTGCYPGTFFLESIFSYTLGMNCGLSV